MIFARRSGERSPHLEWRIRLFGVGAILGMVGIWAQQGWLVNAAIAVLLVGFALRFRRRSGDADASERDGDPTA